jgi:hypothetical protein
MTFALLQHGRAAILRGSLRERLRMTSVFAAGRGKPHATFTPRPIIPALRGRNSESSNCAA